MKKIVLLTFCCLLVVSCWKTETNIEKTENNKSQTTNIVEKEEKTLTEKPVEISKVTKNWVDMFYTSEYQKLIDNSKKVPEEDLTSKDLLFIWESYKFLWNFKQAIVYYKKVLEKEPENTRAIYNIASINYDTFRNFEEWLKYMLKYDKLRPNNFTTLSKIWRIYSDMKNFKQAEVYFKRSLEIQQNQAILKQLAMLYSFNWEYLKSITYYEKMNNLSWNDFMNYIITLFLDKQYTKLVSEYDKYKKEWLLNNTRIDRNIARYYVYSSVILWNKQEAINLLKELQKNNPSDPNILMDLYMLDSANKNTYLNKLKEK